MVADLARNGAWNGPEGSKPNQGNWGPYREAIEGWAAILGRPAPPPARPGRLAIDPLFAEWIMGWPRGWITDVPGLSATARIRLAGNGVVPHQAEAALHHLLTAPRRTTAARN